MIQYSVFIPVTTYFLLVVKGPFAYILVVGGQVQILLVLNLKERMVVH